MKPTDGTGYFANICFFASDIQIVEEKSLSQRLNERISEMLRQLDPHLRFQISWHSIAQINQSVIAGIEQHQMLFWTVS